MIIRIMGEGQVQIAEGDIDVLNLQDGTAQMWDAPAEGAPLDATIDRLDKGFWTAVVSLSKEDKPFVSTFTGRRIGDTAQPSR